MHRSPRSHPALVATAVSALLVLSGCSATKVLQTSPSTGGASGHGRDEQVASAPKPFAGTVSMNVRRRAPAVHPGHQVVLTAVGATLRRVVLRGPSGVVAGALTSSGATWRATGALRPLSAYTLRATAVDRSGTSEHFSRSFRTGKLPLSRLTYPSFAPTDGSTVGIAMPVVVRFDVPVTDRASIQKHLEVSSVPAQPGAWHWISATEVHWRPRTYWRAGSTVTVRAEIADVPAGNGIYGQLDRAATFHVGRAQVLKVDMRTDELTVLRDGHAIRTIPVTTGAQPEFTTRSGTKVIMEKDRSIDMNSGTIGIDPDSPQGYDLKDVEFAMRLTDSGEFLHAAPWSVAFQGRSNVSHGCTGMSTANAEWLFDHSLVGDPVEYSGTSRQMTLTNGYGDWNESFAQYATGGA